MNAPVVPAGTLLVAAVLCAGRRALRHLPAAAGGRPAIGSLIDYAAFCWAEALIAVALVATVLSGIAVDTRPAQPKKTSAS